LEVQTVQNTSYLQTQTIIRALEFAMAKGGFSGNAKQIKTATELIREMKSTKSVSGRHQQLTGLLRKGSSIQDMVKATGSSRRTVFRYLNHFEDAGLDITITDGKYRLK
jgi:biotin operon repressor